MKISTKFGISMFVIMTSVSIASALDVPAELITNQVIVNQMSNSDIAYATVSVVGNGSSFLNKVIAIIDIIILAVVWTRKSN